MGCQTPDMTNSQHKSNPESFCAVFVIQRIKMYIYFNDSPHVHCSRLDSFIFFCVLGRKTHKGIALYFRVEILDQWLNLMLSS